MPWDWSYYSEKLKDIRFNVNDEMTRPYFKLENVKKVFSDLPHNYMASHSKRTKRFRYIIRKSMLTKYMIPMVNSSPSFTPIFIRATENNRAPG